MPAIYEPLPHPEYVHQDYPLVIVPGTHNGEIMLDPGVTVHSKEEHDAWIAAEEAKLAAAVQEAAMKLAAEEEAKLAAEAEKKEAK